MLVIVLPFIVGILQFFMIKSVSGQAPNGCFDLTQAQALTFYKDAMTTSARAPPIKQLNCAGGNGCSYAGSVSVVQCTNSGTDGSGNVQWKCTAQLPANVDLGSTTVSCEGCKSSTDFYKVSGSCGLFYTLNMVSSGSHDDVHSNDDAHHIRKNDGSNSGGYILLIFLVIIIVLLVVCCVWKVSENYTYADTTYVSPVSAIPMTTTISHPQNSNSGSYGSVSYQNSYTAIPSAPPANAYRPVQPYSSYSGNNNNGFTQGLIMGEMASGHHNRVVEDAIIIDAVSGGGSNGFTNGLLLGSVLNNNHGGSNKHHNTSHSAPPKHHGTSHGAPKPSHVSTGFGGTITR